MDAANIVTHSAGRGVSHANKARRSAVIPVRVRFLGFELDEANALLLRNGQAVALAPRPFQFAVRSRAATRIPRHQGYIA